MSVTTNLILHVFCLLFCAGDIVSMRHSGRRVVSWCCDRITLVSACHVLLRSTRAARGNSDSDACMTTSAHDNFSKMTSFCTASLPSIVSLKTVRSSTIRGCRGFYIDGSVRLFATVDFVSRRDSILRKTSDVSVNVSVVLVNTVRPTRILE